MSIHQFSAELISGETIKMSTYAGKVLLIVNTASQCGFTPQYQELEELYQEYRDLGLEILAFPCNQFGNQEPGTNEEIYSFCTTNYSVSFPIFKKIEVKGPGIHPIFDYLTSHSRGLITKSIKWNFTKFLVDRHGHVYKRFAPTVSPKNIKEEIKELL